VFLKKISEIVQVIFLDASGIGSGSNRHLRHIPKSGESFILYGIETPPQMYLFISAALSVF